MADKAEESPAGDGVEDPGVTPVRPADTAPTDTPEPADTEPEPAVGPSREQVAELSRDMFEKVSRYVNAELSGRRR